jgi:uncharacterized protein YjiS (DUF1127 family)
MIAELALPAAPRPSRVADALRALLAYLLSMRELARQRRALEALDDRLLRDVGLRRRGYWPGTD